MKTIFLTVIGYILDLIMLIWAGFVLSILWKWFIVPQFNLAPLSVIYAMGVYLVMGYLTKENKLPDPDTEIKEIFCDTITLGILKPLTFLVIGWITTWFI